jgi:micrococcal nuclease
MARTSVALDPWTYRARLVRVIDADTLEMELDLGFGVVKSETLRLADLDAPELNTAEGRAVRAIVLDWVDDAKDGDWPLLVTTRKTDKYRRYIATIRDATTARPALNETLLTLGYAKPWPAP